MELQLLQSPALQMHQVFPILPQVLLQLFKQRIKKLPKGYNGMALALSDPSNEDSISLLSNARATAAASQDTLLSTIESIIVFRQFRYNCI